MTFVAFLEGLSDEQLAAYAKRCGTSPLYIRNHLRGVSRIPRSSLMNKLWEESDGVLTRQDVLDHFFSQANSVSAAG